jgi:hypothetical protein
MGEERGNAVTHTTCFCSDLEGWTLPPFWRDVKVRKSNVRIGNKLESNYIVMTNYIVEYNQQNDNIWIRLDILWGQNNRQQSQLVLADVCTRYETVTVEKLKDLQIVQEFVYLANDLWNIKTDHRKSIEYAFIIRIMIKIGGETREISISGFLENFGSRYSGFSDRIWRQSGPLKF